MTVRPTVTPVAMTRPVRVSVCSNSSRLPLRAEEGKGEDVAEAVVAQRPRTACIGDARNDGGKSDKEDGPPADCHKVEADCRCASE